MSVKKRMTRARTGLILSSPFFATLALQLILEETTEVPTMRTNSKKIWYNPEFVESLADNEVVGVIAHEVMHIVLGHHYRKGYRDHDKWQTACDYAVNPVLIESGFDLPGGLLIDPKFKDMSAEAIYDKLPDSPKNNSQPKGGGSGSSKDKDKGKSSSKGSAQGNKPKPSMGEVEQYSPKPGEKSIPQQKNDWKVAISRAEAVAKSQGKLPGGLERLIKEELETGLPWEEILAGFVVEHVRNDYTWTMPNKRYLHTGLYLPQLKTPSLGTIAVIIDTSISISQVEIDMFASELREILSVYPETEILVIYVDTEVAGTDTVGGYNLDFDLHMKGGGGTDFRPGFEYIEAEGVSPACVIYFTDGWCDLFPEDPGYPTLWAVVGKKNMKPPFGTVTEIVNNKGE